MRKTQDQRVQKWPCNRRPHLPLAFCGCLACRVVRSLERRAWLKACLPLGVR